VALLPAWLAMEIPTVLDLLRRASVGRLAPRRETRCEDRIRHAKDTGLRNLPLHDYQQNQLWCEIVALACELLAWTAKLAHAPAALAMRA
jgi:Transposase DDE domain group 1